MALSRLYFVTMDGAPMGPLEQIGEACRAGIRLIQLRMKEVSDQEFLQTAREARQLLGEGKIVGGTANRLEDIREHYLGGADYIGLGPYRYTTTKMKLSPILGLEGYQQMMRALVADGMEIPVMAIGGIGLADVGPLLEAGVYGVAFSGLLVQALDREGVVRILEEEIKTS